MKFGQKGIITLAFYKPDEILDQTGCDIPDKNFTVNTQIFKVSMTSKRYELFKKNRRCECCGIEGTVMALQRFKDNRPGVAHFNLYGCNSKGEMVLLTKDHIIPVSKGGGDESDNFRTMCERCNLIRGNQDVTMDELRKLIVNWTSGKKARKKALQEARVLKRWKRRLNRARKLGLIMAKIEPHSVEC